MTATANGKVMATATPQTADAGPPHTRALDRNTAITTLILAERVITHGEEDPCVIEWRRELAMTHRLIRMTTALAVVAVAAVISYRHAYELVHTHGESGPTARLVPSRWTA